MVCCIDPSERTAMVVFCLKKEGKLMHTGSCLCGGVSFNVSTDLQPPDACHCTACRKWLGHFLSQRLLSQARLICLERIRSRGTNHPKRFGGSFCSVCGSTLFFDPLFHDWTAIAMGAFDGPTGTALARHIFVYEKADYYPIKDGLPQNQT